MAAVGLRTTAAPVSERAADVVARYGMTAIILTMPLEFTAAYLRQPLVRWVMVVAALALAFLVVARGRAIIIPRNLSIGLLLGYVAVSVASWLLTRAPGSTSSLLDVVLYPIAGLVMVNLLQSEDDHRRAWTAFLVSGVLISLLGVALYIGHFHVWVPHLTVQNRLNITFGDPNITARFLSLCACAAVLMYAARQGPSWLSIATAGACAAVLPMTLSRSGLVLFVVTIVLAMMFAFDRRRAAAIGAVALVVFAASTAGNPDTRQRANDAAMTAFSAVTGKTLSARSAVHATQGQVTLEDNRTYLVAAGLQMFRDHPIAGVGLGGYQHAILTTYQRYLPPRYIDSLSHTSVVTVAAEQGVIGLLLLVAFLLQLAREAWLARRRGDSWATWSTIPATLVIPIFLYSQFEGRFLQEPYLWLALACLYSSHRLATMRQGEEQTAARARAQGLEAA